MRKLDTQGRGYVRTLLMLFLIAVLSGTTGLFAMNTEYEDLTDNPLAHPLDPTRSRGCGFKEPSLEEVQELGGMSLDILKRMGVADLLLRTSKKTTKLQNKRSTFFAPQSLTLYGR
ncbi:MAG: hypothetical protein ACYSR1_09495 [Planctomycetota bacterium]|jgi:hypothetical protein